VEANEAMANWLLKEVFATLEVPFVVAGKNPSPRLQKLAHAKAHTCLVSNPSNQELQDMIAKAHINVVPAYIDTGVKIKWLNALFNGRHCVGNTIATKGCGEAIKELTHLADTAADWQEKIASLYHQPFRLEERMHRKIVLDNVWGNNETQARKIMEKIWPPA
jgi:hypothetical protein